MLSLLILFASFTFGLAAVAIVMVLMGFGGAPGAMVFEIGKRKESLPLRCIGLLLTFLGQSYVVGAYSVLMISLLRYFTYTNPNAWVWPLWIVAFFHSTAAPTYAMKEKSESAHYYTLPEVALAVIVIFFVTVFFPKIVSFAYGWIPCFAYNLS